MMFYYYSLYTVSHLKDCYFANLQHYTVEELRTQEQTLLMWHQGLLREGKKAQNRRRTLRRQIEKVRGRVAEMVDGCPPLKHE
jgi:hypothetical protein